MATLADFPVNLTNSQRRSLNASRNMQHMRTGLNQGDKLEGLWVDRSDAMSWDTVTVQTDANCFVWIITPRGRIVSERIMKRALA